MTRIEPRVPGRLLTIGLLAVISLGLALAVPRTASAAATCSLHGTLLKVQLGSGDTATLARSGDAIQLDGAACGAATVNNTGRVTVTGSTGNEKFVLDLRGGPFAPGSGAEATGTPEIEISVSLGAGTDRLAVLGTTGDDAFSLGSLGINLNGDDDADVILVATEKVAVTAFAGTDTVSGAGGAVTGTAFALPLVVWGGPGNDTVVGGTANDFLQGQGGTDGVKGRQGNDRAGGGSGTDSLRGANGNDILRGRADKDHLVGGPGSDQLFGGTGDDSLNTKDTVEGNDTGQGGAGTDTCVGDPKDTFTGCEK
jgi:Ca2+-binding RTX toxin-like protein